MKIIFFALSLSTLLLPLEAQDITLPLSENLSAAVSPQVAAAVQHYHDTRPFALTKEQYKSDPEFYFRTRIEALDAIIEKIPENTLSSEEKDIYERALSKKIYLETLYPSLRDPRCTKKDFIPVISKDLSLKGLYWYESLDPLHRVGLPVDLHIKRWKVSGLPNYFIYLETVEHDPLIQKYIPFVDYVEYIASSKEREKFRLTFPEGKAYLLGKTFDSREMTSRQGLKGKAIYVIGPDNEIYVQISQKKYKHSSIFAGGVIKSAGEIKVKNGLTTKLNNNSGHYTPGIKHLLDGLEVFSEKTSLALTELSLNLFSSKHKVYNKIKALYNAEEFLAKRGEVAAMSTTLGWTPLHVAIFYGQLSLASEVIRPEWLGHKEELEGQTPLHLAVEVENELWIEALLDAGADTTLRNFNHLTPFHLACKTGNAAIMKRLYSSGNPLNGPIYLFLAASSGSIEAVKFLTDLGLDKAVKDADGNTIFHYAMRKGNCPLVKYLMEQDDANFNEMPNNKGELPMHLAAQSGDVALIKTIGVNFKVDKAGNNILHHAALGGNGPIAQYLLKNGYEALLLSKNCQGITPFHYACERLHPDLLELFIQKGSNLEDVDLEGKTPLFYAAKASEVNTAFLINQGANLSHVCGSGMMPIHCSAYGNFLSSAMMLTYRDQLRIKSGKGNTLIHEAVIAKNLPLLSFLKPHLSGEDILEMNEDQKTVLDLALESGSESILNIIYSKLQDQK